MNHTNGMHKQMSHEKLMKALNDLIDVNLDGADGYKAAAEALPAGGMRSLFNEYAEKRRKFSEELQDEVKSLAGEPDQNGTARAAVHRGWISLKAAITGGDTQAIIAECNTGDQIALDTYERVLQEDFLPDPARVIIRRQADLVRVAKNSIEAMKK